jgi:hypothetical protein
MVQKINVLNFMWHPFRLRRRSAKALRGLGVVLPAGCGARRQSLRKAEQSHSTSEQRNDLTFATRYAPAVCPVPNRTADARVIR